MTLQYEDIYSCFLQKCTDYSFLEYDKDTMFECMNGWLHSAASVPYLRARFTMLNFDDDFEEITFELSTSVDEFTDTYFVKEVLSIGMIIEWLKPQVNNVLYIKQMFAGKEEKFYSQSNHLAQLQSLLEQNQRELRSLIRDHAYINNSYISES